MFKKQWFDALDNESVQRTSFTRLNNRRHNTNREATTESQFNNHDFDHNNYSHHDDKHPDDDEAPSLANWELTVKHQPMIKFIKKAWKNVKENSHLAPAPLLSRRSICGQAILHSVSHGQLDSCSLTTATSSTVPESSQREHSLKSLFWAFGFWWHKLVDWERKHQRTSPQKTSSSSLLSTLSTCRAATHNMIPKTPRHLGFGTPQRKKRPGAYPLNSRAR